MTVKIVYVGIDTCHRLKVLRASGFVVENVVALTHINHEGTSQDVIAAILLSDRDGEPPLDVLQLLRMQTRAPLVLFHDSNRDFGPSEFDLVVPNLTPPSRWLAALASLAPMGEKMSKMASWNGSRSGINGLRKADLNSWRPDSVPL